MLRNMFVALTKRVHGRFETFSMSEKMELRVVMDGGGGKDPVTSSISFQPFFWGKHGLLTLVIASKSPKTNI